MQFKFNPTLQIGLNEKLSFVASQVARLTTDFERGANFAVFDYQQKRRIIFLVRHPLKS